MDLPELQSITFDDATSQLIADVDELAKKVNELRPLPPDLVQAVQSKLLGERIYNSNAIEGSTVTLRETIGILQAGAALNVRRRRDAQEVLGLKDAIERVQSLVPEEAWCTLGEMLAVHEVLFRDVEKGIAGRLRNEDVMLTGAKHQPPDASAVADLINAMFSQVGSGVDFKALHCAIWVHWGIARIHPFVDGNGRMARLWQDLALLKGGLSVAIIRQQDRNEYYQSLTAADDGDFNPLAQLIAQRVAATLEVYLLAQQEADSLKSWAAQIVGESAARAADRRRLEYMRWKHQMELFRDAFERCAAQLTNASSGAIEIQVESYAIIDQSAWESLRAGTGAKRTWFFKLNCRREKRVLRYFFFFGRHFWTPDDPQTDGIGARVCLLVSELDGQSEDREAKRLDELEDTPLTLREVLVNDTQLVRKRWDNHVQKMAFDLIADPVRVAQDFLQEVLLLRLA